MQNMLQQGRTAWVGVPRRAQLAIAVVVIATIFVMFLVVRASTSTSWVAVATDLSTAKQGEAQTTLEEAGFETRLSETGGALEVPKDVASKAAAALMQAGIAAKGSRVDCSKQFSEGSSMMAKTSTETAIMIETCQENQAANAIENIQGVENASVDVTVADNSMFAEEAQPAKGTVSVQTDGSPLAGKTVQGIQKSVAARFEGLTPGAVIVTDESGAAISDSADGSGGVGGEDSLKLRTEAEKNAEVEAKLTKALEKIVGAGKVVVTSNVVLDMDAIKRNVIEHQAAGEEGDQLVETEGFEKELLNGAVASGVQGTTGTGANVGVDPDNRTVTPDVDADASTDGDYLGDKGTRQYANNKVGEVINVRPGSVVAQRIGVVVDESVSDAGKNAVKNAVQAWMGGNAEDSFSFDQAPLAAAEDVATKGDPTTTMLSGYLKWGLLGLGLIGLAFVLRRSLTQRTAELLSPADDLLMLEPGDFTPIPIAELEAALAASSPDPVRVQRIEMQRKVENIAEAKPQDVANELRRWMGQEDMGLYSAPSKRRAG